MLPGDARVIIKGIFSANHKNGCDQTAKLQNVEFMLGFEDDSDRIA